MTYLSRWSNVRLPHRTSYGLLVTYLSRLSIVRLPRRTCDGLLVTYWSRLSNVCLSHRLLAVVMANQCHLLRRALAKRNRFELTCLC